MRKLLFPVIALTLVLLMVIPAMAAVEPTVTTGRSDPDSVYVGVVESWTITIGIYGDDEEDLDNVVVQGGIGADLVVTYVGLEEVDPPLVKKESRSYGDVTLIKKGGKMGATIVRWDIGILAEDDFLTLVLVVQTGENPADKQEFTSVEEDHALDGGFSATYTYLGVEYETLETDPLLVDVTLAP